MQRKIRLFMQTQKQDIRKVILEVARAEFIEYGFKNASMRIIAKKSGVGLSNIYNYFKDKDEIYIEVLSPLLNTFNKILSEHNDNEHLSLEIFSSEEYLQNQVDMFLNLIVSFKKELKLLLFQSYGSSLENFKDEFSDKHTDLGLKYIKKMKEIHPHINSNVSNFFIHTISSWWLSIIGEIATHDDLTNKDIKVFIAEYMDFATAGWKKIMKI